MNAYSLLSLCGQNKSLYRNSEPFISDEWVKVKINLKPYIVKAINKANESDAFGQTVSVDDFYISGTNIGFETHGNYGCTIEIKNFSLTSFNKR